MSEQFELKKEIYVAYKGEKVLSQEGCKLLVYLKRTGSLLSASKILGISYSRAWDIISKFERKTGIKIVIPRRGGAGGGGMQLTDIGDKIVKMIQHEIDIIEKRMKYPDLHFAGSHDPLLEEIINLIRGDHDVEISFIGSAAGLSSLMIGDADIAGIHLFDPSTNKYNIPFLKNFWLEHKVIVIGGYLREIGFVYKKEIGYINGIDDIISKKLKFINRVGGSGTRILIDYLLYKYSKENSLDISELKSKILGYNIEVKTHEDVIREILLGNFDIGVSLRYFADKYNLSFTPLKWERYDYIILNDRLHKKLIKEFIDVLKPQKLHDIIKKFKGYKIYNNTGKRIYP